MVSDEDQRPVLAAEGLRKPLTRFCVYKLNTMLRLEGRYRPSDKSHL